MAERVTLAKLRAIKLPAPKEKEEDHLTSLRKTLSFHADSPDTLVICVTDEIADLVPDDTPTTAPNATLKS